MSLVACGLCATTFDQTDYRSWVCVECRTWARARQTPAAAMAKQGAGGGDSRGVLWQLYQRSKDLECDSCGREFSEQPRTRYSHHIDHDHSTGRIRASLCGACNHIIGFADENIAQLQCCILYLQRQQVQS